MKKVVFNSIELKTLAAASGLKSLGVEVQLYENEKEFSFDSSFTLVDKEFDVGYHAVDVGRNSVWDDILLTLPIEWHHTGGSRALVCFGMLLKRFYSQSELGEKFENIDHAAHADPYLRRLERAFGTDLVNHVLSEIVPSYAQNSIWKKNNCTSQDVLKNIYPWFFPAALARDDLPNFDHFHSIERELGVRYPSCGSFGSISEALKLQLQGDIVRNTAGLLVLSGKHITPSGTLSIPHPAKSVFVMAIDHLSIAEKLGIAAPKSEQTTFYLTSIVASNKLKIDFNEYLVGDVRHRFDRVSSPDFLRGSKDVRSLQFETEALSPVDEAGLLDEAIEFAKLNFGLESVLDTDIKTVKIRRFYDPDVTEKSETIIRRLEQKNPLLVISNRSLSFQNLADGVPQLIARIEEKVCE